MDAAPRIRPAGVDDLPAVLSAYLAAGINDPGEALHPAGAAQILARFRRYPDYTLYVAEIAGDFAGTYALLIMDNLGHGGAPSGIVEDVAVLPGYQGRGIGRAMMQHAMDTCAAKGCYKLTLSSNARRHDAHAFYGHLGFERHGYSFRVTLDARPPAANAPGAGTPTAAPPVGAASRRPDPPPTPTPGVRPNLAVAECAVCGGPTYELHCKIICRTCGFTRDCSDP